MENFIKGTYRKAIYSSDKGYIIGIFKVRETNIDSLMDYVGKTITFTGYFHDLNFDDTYIMYGSEITHPRYGHQFQVSEYERCKPEGKDGVIEFLASDLFPGIGEKMATTIVNTLGDNTLDLILENSSNLYMVPKLSKKKADLISETLKNYDESHSTIVYLTELGFSMKDSLLIYNSYFEKTLDLIDTNIYQVIDDIPEINFLKVDEIALKMDFLLDDSRRVKATIIYIMNNLLFQNGDTYLKKDYIYEQLVRYLKVDVSDNFESYLFDLESAGKIVIEDSEYYLKDIYLAENNIAENIILRASKDITKFKKTEQYFTELEEHNDIDYNEKQKEAIIKALENNILIITGGPGTGKTTIIKAIIEMYEKLYKIDYAKIANEVVLLAPTGRASKRMSEATSMPASTIHRFLRWNKETGSFAVNERNQAEFNMVIVDEVSMIDTLLLDSLFKGLDRNTKIVLVGDYNQLPSVGPGQLLKDLIDSNIIDTVHLDLLYRQDENSYINILAGEIKNDELSEHFLSPKEDFTFLECNAYSLNQNIKNVCKQIVDKGYDYKKVQVLAPMYHGENGIDNLNKELQEIFNPPSDDKRELKSGEIVFRENDKILQLVNQPEENVFNGDIGVIKRIMNHNTTKSGKNELHIDFDGNIVVYTPQDFIRIKHGFIVSIHKAQGSEFEVVVMPIVGSYKRMLYRKLIYTAVTRAKKKLIILGESSAFTYSVHNNSEYIRQTSLLRMIQNRLYNK